MNNLSYFQRGDKFYVFCNGREFEFNTVVEAQDFVNDNLYPNYEQEWEEQIRGVVGTARTLIKTLSDMSADSTSNDLTSILLSATDGQFVGVSNIKKEHALLLVTVFQSMTVWLQTPLAEGQPTPEQVLRMRF